MASRGSRKMVMKEIKKIGVFTSGGDSPGMNAAIRAVARTCAYYGIKCVGINNGYDGLINDNVTALGARSVSQILQMGGTMLGSARSEEFRTIEGRKKAYETIQKNGIDALVAIGGNGTFTGADVFLDEYAVPTIGLPGTIDNDLYGTDLTIGYTTAINTVMEAIDKIRDTATSHNRLFFVEVMGRDAGFIALQAGIACGAMATMLPEEEMSIADLIKILDQGRIDGKKSSIVIVSEGDANGGANAVAEQVSAQYDYYDIRVSVLGHMQRGGSPCAVDRIIAGRMGVKAVEALQSGVKNAMIGIQNDKMEYVPFEQAIFNIKEPDLDKIRIAKILAR